MSPLQHIRSYNIRNKKMTWGAITWVGLLSLSLLYCHFYSPLNPCHHLGAGNDRLRSVVHLWSVKLSRKGIRLGVLRAWSIRENELKAVKKKKRAHRAWRGFSLLASWMYVRFLWSVQMTNGCLAPSSQCLHSWSASFTASNSRLPIS